MNLKVKLKIWSIYIPSVVCLKVIVKLYTNANNSQVNFQIFTSMNFYICEHNTIINHKIKHCIGSWICIITQVWVHSWIFFIKKVALIKIIKLLLSITKLHSKGLERSIKDVGAKKKHYLMFLIRFWHSIICSLAFFLVYIWTWYSNFV